MDADIARLARNQLGLLARPDLIALGATDHWIHHQVRRGWLEVLHAGVYRVAGSPSSWEQALLAACLAAGDGAVASHQAAAGLWGLDGPFRGAVEIAVTRLQKSRPAKVTVHRSTDLVPAHVTTRRGVPVTNPLRTLVDLGAVVRQPILDRAVDDALARGRVDFDGLLTMLDMLGRRGRRGVGPLRKSLAGRADVPASVLEAEFQRLIRRYGLPEPVYQYELFDRAGRFVARIDAVYLQERIAIELDGAATHARRGALQHDLARQNRILDCGLLPYRYTWHDVVGTPERTANAVERVLVQRRGEFGLEEGEPIGEPSRRQSAVSQQAKPAASSRSSLRRFAHPRTLEVAG